MKAPCAHAVLIVCLATGPVAGSLAENVRICAANSDDDDFAAEFEQGPIMVPAGAVFQIAGAMISADLGDPDDVRHGVVSDSMAPAEKKRRDEIIASGVNLERSSAVATTEPALLTRAAPCAFAAAQALVSSRWGWKYQEVEANPSFYYQLSGVLRRGFYDANPDPDSRLGDLNTKGELNAMVIRTTTATLDVDAWSAAQPPDEAPVVGHGNSECLGIADRQDITCRALTEKLLMSLRGARRADVQRAMNVAGAERGDVLHFLSSYGFGQRAGGGDVNFRFGADGRVNVIFGLLDAPSGGPVDFIWNALRLPAGCSGLPGSKLPPC